MTQICIWPQVSGLGGPASFVARLSAGIRARGIDISYRPTESANAAVLVIGGTRRLDYLWQARKKGIRIVQRLNGMNWLHRRRNTGLKHFLRAEWSNWLLANIRGRYANHIIYQSRFSKDWWREVRGPVKVNESVIYNGIDLSAYSPEGLHQRPADHYRILMVEAHMGGGMDTGLENALGLIKTLAIQSSTRWELMIAGDVPEGLRRKAEAAAPECWITWSGVVKRDQVPELDRSAHMLFSADLAAACPNSVVEALACGLPVISYATGALTEMVSGDAGRIVPYGSNFWRLEPPDVEPLAVAAQEVAANQMTMRKAARSRAESAFDIHKVVDDYLAVLLG